MAAEAYRLVYTYVRDVGKRVGKCTKNVETLKKEYTYYPYKISF